MVTLLATAVTTALVSGCSGSDEPAKASRAKATVGSAADAEAASDRDAHDGSPSDVLAGALEELASLDTGRYRHVITIRDSVSSVSVEDLENNPVSEVGIRFTGAYWLSAKSATVTGVAFDEDREQVQVRERIDGGRVFMQLPGWPKAVRRCWVILSDDAVDGLLRWSGDNGAPLPMALAALDEAHAVDLAGEDLSAEIPVGTALAAVAPGLVRKAQEADLEASSPITVHIRDGRLTGWEAWGRDVMDVLDESGFAIRGPFRKLGHTSAKITLSGAGQPVAPQAPPRRLRLTQAEVDRGETCGA